MAIFGFKQKKYNKTEQGADAAKAAPSNKKAAPKKAQATKIAPGLTTKDIAAPAAAPKAHIGNESHFASIILRPRVTEKSGILSQMGVYTFEVARNANKDAVAKAVQVLYKVVPVKIAIINVPAKNVFVKGRRGTVSGIKKAMVTLKKGDKIDFV
jgi:large subunit ribosomal protein L23